MLLIGSSLVMLIFTGWTWWVSLSITPAASLLTNAVVCAAPKEMAAHSLVQTTNQPSQIVNETSCLTESNHLIGWINSLQSSCPAGPVLPVGIAPKWAQRNRALWQKVIVCRIAEAQCLNCTKQQLHSLCPTLSKSCDILVKGMDFGNKTTWDKTSALSLTISVTWSELRNRSLCLPPKIWICYYLS